ncbi:hypothetical protein KJ866_00165 [Patescibacteria group bacterium]|nr:hypothetical protein [Patescibacteria group bacterium]MBU2264815.1 hypothetical protein [Patescibacteria group bacterium]
MTPIEAEEIINKYWKSYKDIGPYSIVQPISDLPCSPGKIRYAHLVYGEELIKRGLIPWGISRKLSSSYQEIHSRFVDDPESINDQHKKYVENLEKGVLDESYQILILERSKEYLTWEIEYNNFLADCQGNYNLSGKE